MMWQDHAAGFFEVAQETPLFIPMSGYETPIVVFPEAFLTAYTACIHRGITSDDGLKDALQARDISRLQAYLTQVLLPIPHETPNYSGMLTAYYSPALTGSLTRTDHFRWPLLKRLPKTWMEKSRHDIEQCHDALAEADYALCWVHDPIDAFFLDVQGSGMIRLETDQGPVERWVAWDGTNDPAYQSLGKSLLQDPDHRDNLPATLDAETLKDYLRQHKNGRELLTRNPSKIFYQWSKTAGPTTASGINASPLATLAVDVTHVALGQIVLTSFVSIDRKNVHLLALAIDTGSAIKGAHRADLYLGAGQAAFAHAGQFQQPCCLQVLHVKAGESCGAVT